MEHNNYPARIAELMGSLEKNAASDHEVFEKQCAELEAYGAAHRDEYIKGFCLFYKGLVGYVLAELANSMRYFSEAINHLIAGEDWYLAARTYNAMGNISDFQGDTSLAIDCYVKGLSMSREHDIYKMQYDIISNIANVYLSLGEIPKATEMLLECERLNERTGAATAGSILIVCANLCLCYIQLGEYEKGEEQLVRLKEICSHLQSRMNDISISILEAELYHGTGNFELRDAAIRRLAEHEFDSMSVFDALNELARHCRLLLKIDKIDEFHAMVAVIDRLTNGPSVEKYVLELKLEYAEKVGDEEAYARLATKYYQVARQREKEHNNIISHNITTKIRLDEEENRRKEVEISNLMLKQKSEQDALTGMNNRHKLNELAELAFHKAYLNGTPLTIEILDIDCYKEFNDNYGHQAGDDCLVSIAGAIRSMEEFNGVHTARYGGDEFVIIYEEYGQKEIERMAQRLRDKIHALNIEHKFSRVSDRITVSQGLFHKIPSGGNKTWDFLYAADMALYIVKNRSRNNYYIGTEFEGVRQSYVAARADAGKF